MSELEKKDIQIIKEAIGIVCKKIINPRVQDRKVYYYYIEQNLYKELPSAFLEMLEKAKEDHQRLKDILDSRSNFYFSKQIWREFISQGANGIKYNKLMQLIKVTIAKHTHPEEEVNGSDYDTPTEI